MPFNVGPFEIFFMFFVPLAMVQGSSMWPPGFGDSPIRTASPIISSPIRRSCVSFESHALFTDMSDRSAVRPRDELTAAVAATLSRLRGDIRLGRTFIRYETRFTGELRCGTFPIARVVELAGLVQCLHRVGRHPNPQIGWCPTWSISTGCSPMARPTADALASATTRCSVPRTSR